MVDHDRVAQSTVEHGVLADKTHMDIGHSVACFDDGSRCGGAHRDAAFHHPEIAKAEIRTLVSVGAQGAATIVAVGAIGRMINVLLNETIRPGQTIQGQFETWRFAMRRTREPDGKDGAKERREECSVTGPVHGAPLTRIRGRR